MNAGKFASNFYYLVALKPTPVIKCLRINWLWVGRDKALFSLKLLGT
jgi:hypothetical protein